MILDDTIKIQGHFKITSYKKDGSVDIYEDKNLVMDVARNTMARMIANNGGVPINKFLIGTQGHSDNNILNPIAVGTNNFNTLRTKLYSQETNAFFYNIKWDSNNPYNSNLNIDNSIVWSDDKISLFGIGNKRSEDGSDNVNHENIPCPVTIEVIGNKVTYTISIVEDAANGDSGLDVVAFTEAALMCDDDIFSMKTFSARVKEDTVRHVIEWAIIF